jgi:Fe-S cluster assembly protein SufD
MDRIRSETGTGKHRLRENTLAVDTAQLGSYLDSFTAFSREAVNDPQWLRNLRDVAFERFCAVGFPTTHDEDWRFTSVASIANAQFSLLTANIRPSASFLADMRIEGAAARLIFVDGRFIHEFSDRRLLYDGVVIDNLRSAIDKQAECLEKHLGRFVSIERDSFCALNSAFVDDGAMIHVRRGVVLERPIHLLFVSTCGEDKTMSHPRNLIVLEDESQASIVEEHVSYGEGAPAFSNAVTELIAGNNATVAHLLLEREHMHCYNVSTLRIEQARSANVVSHSVLLGGALVRNNVHPVLSGEGGECLINGLFIGGGRQHLDNYMLVEHVSPHCASRQFYNGILDEQAHGVFHGRIIVHKNAQQTDAKQTNRNLLLTDDAQVDTKPQLEIYADDVKCTHGATIGQIEEDALFYLRSRGIREIEARRILLEAFAGECLERIQPATLRAYARRAIEGRLLSLSNPHPAQRGANSAHIERRWKETE